MNHAPSSLPVDPSKACNIWVDDEDHTGAAWLVALTPREFFAAVDADDAAFVEVPMLNFTDDERGYHGTLWLRKERVIAVTTLGPAGRRRVFEGFAPEDDGS